MRTWLENKWETLRTNFWFVPVLMTIIAVLSFFALLRIDQFVGYSFPGLQPGRIEAVRSLLAVLVGALVTALTFVFSGTVVVLTLAASQLGPRLLRTYMRDRSNQILIGVFVAALFYNLTALFVVGRLAHAEGIPNLAILGSFALSCTALVILVYFVHHISRTIQAPNVILAVSEELMALIDRIHSKQEDDDRNAAHDEFDVRMLPERSGTVRAPRSGYLQAIDQPGLVAKASEHNCIIKTVRRPGDFVIEGDVLAEILSSKPVRENLGEELAPTFMMGSERTATQDPEFVMLELVEIALRALSPGINDPLTANTCIDRLAEALSLLVSYQPSPTTRYDEQGHLRLILDETTFDGLCNTAFNQIRQHASSQVAVVIHLLEALAVIMGHARTDKQKHALWCQAKTLKRAAERMPEPADREDIQKRFEELRSLYQSAQVPEPA